LVPSFPWHQLKKNWDGFLSINAAALSGSKETKMTTLILLMCCIVGGLVGHRIANFFGV
jgi:hypothetical protein